MTFTPTSLNILSQCGEKFRLRYIERINLAPTVRMVIGRIVDTLVTRNLERRKNRQPSAPPKLADVSPLVQDIVIREELRLTEEQAQRGLRKTVQEIEYSALRMAQLHHACVAPKLNPTHLQRPFTVQVGGHQLSGQLDIQESLRSVRDTKVRTRAPNADEAGRSLQLSCYALAVAELDGAIPSALCLDVLVDSQEPKVRTLMSTRNREQLVHIGDRMELAARVIKSGDFVPCEPDNWRCSPHYCEYYSICRYV